MPGVHREVGAVSEPLEPLTVRAQAPEVLEPPSADLGLTWRPLAESDTVDLHVLFGRIEEADDPPYRTTMEEARENFRGEWKDPQYNSIGGFDAGQRLRAYGTVTVHPGDVSVIRAFLEGGVDPDLRRRGIGTALLDWQLGRARQLLAATGKDAPGRILVHVENGMADAAEMLTERGFRQTRWYTEMRRDLSKEIPQTKLASHFDVVPWSAELDDQVRLAHNDAFAEHGGSEPHTPETWQDGRTYFAPSWSFLVLDRTTDRAQVAGYLYSGRYEQDWVAVGGSEGYVDILGVRRPWRGQGIGSALMGRALKAYAADGMQYAGLGVDSPDARAGFGLFDKFGFEPFRGSAMYTLDI